MRLTMGMQACIRETGNPNPATNTALATLIDKAKKSNMPKATIQRVLDKAVNAAKNGQEVISEFRNSSSGVCLRIEGFVDNPKHFKNMLAGSVRKFGYAEPKNSFFEGRGLILADGRVADRQLDLEEVEEHAIMAGAEEVELVEDGVKFDCASEDLTTVTEELRQLGYSISVSQQQYHPTMPVSLKEDAELASFKKVMARLNQVEGVSAITNNIENYDHEA